MKKIIAVLMAALLLCGCFAFGVSAAGGDGFIYHQYTLQPDETLVILNFGEGISRDNIDYYDFDKGAKVYNKAEGEVALVLKKGESFTFPVVSAPEGYICTGWQNTENANEVIGSGTKKVIDVNDLGKHYEYHAQLTAAEVGPSTLDTVKSILIKIFGVIIGLFYGDIDAGQELVAKLFGMIIN